MLQDFIFSAEGFEYLKGFKDKFYCSFRIEEPSGSTIILDTANQSYAIPEHETLDGFKAAIEKSIETGENILTERYKDTQIEYDDDVFY